MRSRFRYLYIAYKANTLLELRHSVNTKNYEYYTFCYLTLKKKTTGEIASNFSFFRHIGVSIINK